MAQMTSDWKGNILYEVDFQDNKGLYICWYKWLSNWFWIWLISVGLLTWVTWAKQVLQG